jgi:hypothetical protein
MYELSDKDLRIEAAKGVLIVLDSNNKPHRINEACMTDFEQFYSLWSVACQLAGTETFMNAWCFVAGFKETMIDALKWLGFTDPEKFSPSQLEALLITYGEGLELGGILFKFHQTYPKLSPKAMDSIPIATSGKMHRKSVTLTLPEFTPISNWMAIARAKVGRYLESCGIWLLNSSPKSPPTPNDGKK